MQDNLPSQTAAFVAFVRALAERGLTTVRGYSDPYAAALLSTNWQRFLDFADRRMQRAPEQARARASRGVDALVLRLMAIDAEVERAIASGIRQLVILGAGLDTRAYRMAALEGVRVFEVDHPATQGHKKKHASALPCAADSVVYVPVHFERETIVGPLAAAGHDPTRPTLWLWEGVIMYLSDQALRQTLADLVERSTPGSVALIHYHEPSTRRGPVDFFRGLFFRIVSEPMIGLRSEATMRNEIERARLTVEHDTSGLDWTRSFGADMPASYSDDRGTHRLAVALYP